MAKFKITYEDITEATTLEQAYQNLLEALASDVKYEDVTAFNFEELSE